MAVFGVSWLAADSTSYELLTTSHPNKVSVNEIKQIPITGFDSQGNSITLYQTITTQRFLELYEAVDIGVRFHNYAITLEGLSKLQRLGITVDVSSSIIVVCDGIRAEISGRNCMHVVGVLAAASAIPVWFMTPALKILRRRSSCESFRYSVDEEFWCYSVGMSKTERLLICAACVGFGGLLWWFGTHNAKTSIRKYLDVLRILLNSPVSVISDCQNVRVALMSIHDIIVGREREVVTAYIQLLSSAPISFVQL